MHLGCLDVDYRPNETMTAYLGFPQWSSDVAADVRTRRSAAAAADYEPGQFYRRELPYVLPLLGELETLPTIIIVDGYVWLGPRRSGFGHALYEALEGRAAVVGVAKNPFRGADAVEVCRGQSARPLYVTAVGISSSDAAEGVAAMHGPFRVPTLLKEVDALCRR